MAWHRVVFIHQPEIRTSHEILRKDHRNRSHWLSTQYECRTRRMDNWETIQKAAALYGKSITANGNRERFLEMFRKDEEALLKQGIQEEDIPLMLDLL